MAETKKLSTTIQGKVIQLDYDFITSLEGQCSYCLTDAQVQMILAVMDYFGWTTRWYSSTGIVDEAVILDLQAGLGRALMNGCCQDNSILYRWTPGGHYQKSTDGGETWADTPTDDPRNPQPLNPPFLPPDTTDNKCTYADSIVQIIKTWVDGLSDGDTYQQILSGLTGVFTVLFGALAPTVVLAIIVGIVGAVITLIINETIPVFQAAMTTDVYNRLRCNIDAHIEIDGSFTQSDVDAVYSQIGTDENGMAALFLQGFVAAAGVIGLANAARTGAGSAAADCDNCSDCCTMALWDFFDGNSGITVTKVNCEWEIDAQQRGDGNWYVIIVSSGVSDCCQATGIDPVSGNVSFQSTAWCGEDGNLVVTGIHPNTSISDYSCTGYLARSGSPFTIKITTDD